MRRLALAAVAVSLAAAAPAHADGARITAEQRTGTRVVTLTISTPAFTTPTKVDVDLPVGYEDDPQRRWPVTYFLAGTMNTYHTFNSLVNGVKLTQDYPSILVSPNGDSGYWSDWFNGGAFGPPMYETYVVEQLIPLIDARFRTVPGRAHRVIMGTSMGGYGSMMIAARHPDLFAAAASLSGAVDSNLPANGAVLSFSPTFQNAAPDAINGPRATQEIRWHGHNPTDLAANLRGLDLQVRSANGTFNPAIGENPLSADPASCVVEAGVYMASVDLHDELDTLKIPHLWQDYGPGCHTVPNFRREIVDTFTAFKKVLAHPPDAPASFDYASIEPRFDVYGWHVETDRGRALEFLRLSGVGPRGLALTGSGQTAVTTPPLFRGLRAVDVTGAGAAPTVATPDAAGRVRFAVDLGAPDTDQENTPGAVTAQRRRTVTFGPHAEVRLRRVTPQRRGLQVCARAVGGDVTATARVTDRAGRAVARSRRLALTSRTRCTTLRWTGRSAGRRATLRLTGTDAFGHPVRAQRTLHTPRKAVA